MKTSIKILTLLVVLMVTGSFAEPSAKDGSNKSRQTSQQVADSTSPAPIVDASPINPGTQKTTPEKKGAPVKIRK